MKLKVTKLGGLYMCALENASQFWENGSTAAIAIGNWMITHGASHGIELSLPAGMRGASVIPIPVDEDTLYYHSLERPGINPMLPGEREWCLREIENTAGYKRRDFEKLISCELAKAVLTVWAEKSQSAAVKERP